MKTWDVEEAIFDGLRALDWYRYLFAMHLICGEFQQQCRVPPHDEGTVPGKDDDSMMDHVLEVVGQVAASGTVSPEASDRAAGLWREWETLKERRDPARLDTGRWRAWVVFTALIAEVAGSRRKFIAAEYVDSSIRDLWEDLSGPQPTARWINNPNEEAADDSEWARALTRVEGIVRGVAAAADLDPAKFREQLAGPGSGPAGG